jgi:hypothetical protein
LELAELQALKALIQLLLQLPVWVAVAEGVAVELLVVELEVLAVAEIIILPTILLDLELMVRASKVVMD